MSVTRIICPGGCGYFMAYCKCKPSPDKSEGGFLVPGVMTAYRPGFLGWVARRFNHPYGWEHFNLSEEIERVVGIRP